MDDSNLLEAIVPLVEEQDVRGLLERGMDFAIALTGAKRGYLFLRGHQSYDDPVVSRGFACRRLEGADIEFSQTLVREVFAGALPHIISDDARGDPQFGDYESVQRYDLQSVLVFPVRSRGEIAAAFYLDDPERTGVFHHVSPGSLEVFGRFFASALERIQEVERARAERDRLAREAAGGYRNFVGEGPRMKAVLGRLEAYIAARDPVLLVGETGTGKEVVARILHHEGPRRGRRFEALNCGTYQGELVESQIFGHKRGAYTGADSDQAGLVEMAEGGTLFLDEIQDMSARLQATLLRFVETGTFRRVGDNKEREADVRLVCATNVPLDRLRSGGQFRSDLYYRISILTLDLPPLRERREDVIDLVDHFSRLEAAERGIPPKTFAAEALARLTSYSWPGNVRELRTFMKRAYVVVPGTEIASAKLVEELMTVTDHTADPDYRWGTPGALDRYLDDLAARKVREVYEAVGENKSEAAKHLGTTRERIRNLLGPGR